MDDRNNNCQDPLSFYIMFRYTNLSFDVIVDQKYVFWIHIQKYYISLKVIIERTVKIIDIW